MKDRKRMNVSIVQQDRKSMAFQVTPAGAVVKIPTSLSPNDAAVRRFIDDALARLPDPLPAGDPLTMSALETLVAHWAERLQVQVKRLQVRSMRSKWGSISTAGVLTLADDILRLPPNLAEYIVVHELMHLRYSDHRRGWRVSMGMYLPDWRRREAQLRAWQMRRDGTSK